MKKDWEFRTLGEVCEKILGGGTPPKSVSKYWNGSVPWASVKDIGEDSFELHATKDHITEDGLKNSSANLIPAGTLIVATRMGLGRIVKSNIDTAINQDLKALFNKKIIETDFLLFFLKTRSKDISSHGEGATVSGIKLEYLRSIPVPVPPIKEQKQIVLNLKNKFKTLSELKELYEQEIETLRDLVQSKFKDLLDSTTDCKIVTLGELCNLATGGTPSRTHKEYFDNGKVKWLVSGDIHQKEIFDCKGRITEEGYKHSNAKYLPINSVLIALNGQGKTRGTVALLRVKATCNQSLVSLYPKNTNALLPEYLFQVLDSRYEEIRKITGDTGNERRGLNMPLIRNIQIPLPPLTIQKEIVKEFITYSKKAKKLEVIYKEKLSSLDELYKAYLKEAFSSDM